MGYGLELAYGIWGKNRFSFPCRVDRKTKNSKKRDTDNELTVTLLLLNFFGLNIKKFKLEI